MEFENPTLAHLIVPVVTITPSPLRYHVRTFYETCQCLRPMDFFFLGCFVGGRPKRQRFVCLVATQPALQVQLARWERTQVVCSNKEAWKRLTESNDTPTMDLGHMNVVLKRCICMLIGDLRNGIKWLSV